MRMCMMYYDFTIYEDSKRRDCLIHLRENRNEFWGGYMECVCFHRKCPVIEEILGERTRKLIENLFGKFICTHLLTVSKCQLRFH